ncbi:MAG: ferredoxin reductase [Solirubrobacteraceae bacterium]
MLATTTASRLLRSPVVDLLVGPHGIDRYLELIRPDLTVHDARAEVIALVNQTARSVTLRLRPNAAWTGFRAGQSISVGIEIDGVRRTRSYSPACSEHGRDGLLELTVTVHPGGLVSRHLQSSAGPGTILHLGEGRGDFVLGEPRPERLVLISGGSGVTPVMSILRTLCDEGHRGEVAVVHYARTEADWLYQPEVQALAARHPGISVAHVATREGGERVSAEALGRLAGELDGAYAAVCGPPSLIEAVRSIWAGLAGGADRVLAETFTAPALRVTGGASRGTPGGASRGTLHFLRSARHAAIGEGTLLEQAEAAGLSPEFGCRMGICHTCTCRKAAGPVRNVLTGSVSSEEDEDIQLCVSVPAGDVALEI